MTAIKKVSFYTARPVETCDRCNAGIANVFCVTYQDGLVEKFGSECINKILAGDTSLKSLFNRNAKKLVKYQKFLAVLSLPDSELPRGREYFNSGLFFIGDGDVDVSGDGGWFFHPLYDVAKNSAGRNYVVTDPAAHADRAHKEIERGKAFFTAEINRIELFLARVLAKAKK